MQASAIQPERRGKRITQRTWTRKTLGPPWSGAKDCSDKRVLLVQHLDPGWLTPGDGIHRMTIRDVKHRTQAVYEAQATAWDVQRNRSLFERPWLDRVLARTSSGDTILDVGCGAGEPIARYIIERERQVCGVDFAEPMLAIARTRLPEGRWIRADMRHFDLGEVFAGLIAWDSFFHLGPDEQRSTIPRLARHVAPGGALLVTVGPCASERIGTVGGESVYHASLSIEDYEMHLQDAGLEVEDFVAEDPGCGGHSVLFAVRRGG